MTSQLILTKWLRCAVEFQRRVFLQFSLMSKQLNRLQLIIEQHVAQPVSDSLPDLAVRRGPLDTMEAVRLAMEQCEDIAVKQHLVSMCLL